MKARTAPDIMERYLEVAYFKKKMERERDARLRHSSNSEGGLHEVHGGLSAICRRGERVMERKTMTKMVHCIGAACRRAENDGACQAWG